jgi:hypothetical protein
MKRLMVLVVALCFVAACATQGDQARTEGTAGGALLGAGAGALLGYAAGGSRGAAIGAATGAVVGGVAGYSYADGIVKRRQQLAGRENNLDARIAFARGVNQDTQEYNQRLVQEINTLEPQIDRLAAKAKQQQITQRELESEKHALNKKVQEANDAAALTEEQLQDLKRFQARQTQTSDKLDAEIADLEGNLAQLRQNTSELASLSQRL